MSHASLSLGAGGCVFGQLSRGAEKCPTSFVVWETLEPTPP